MFSEAAGELSGGGRGIAGGLPRRAHRGLGILQGGGPVGRQELGSGAPASGLGEPGTGGLRRQEMRSRNRRCRSQASGCRDRQSRGEPGLESTARRPTRGFFAYHIINPMNVYQRKS